MEEELESSYIQHYPIGGENALKVKYSEDDIHELLGINTYKFDNRNKPSKKKPRVIIGTYRNVGGYMTDLVKMVDIKPILRPMSDLCKPLEDGSIPIVELAKIATNNTGGWKLFNNIASNVEKGMSFYWNTITKGFDLRSIAHDTLHQMIDQLALFEYLFKHHFDVYRLIEKGLAIDIKTIEK